MIDPRNIVRASAGFAAVALLVAFAVGGGDAAVSVGVGAVLVIAELFATTRRVRRLLSEERRRWFLFGPSLAGVALALYLLLPILRVPWLCLGLSSVVAAITAMGLWDAARSESNLAAEAR